MGETSLRAAAIRPLPSERASVITLLINSTANHWAIASSIINVLTPDNIDPKKRFIPSTELVGTWQGELTVGARTVPIRLNIDASGWIGAQIGTVPLQEVRGVVAPDGFFEAQSFASRLLAQKDGTTLPLCLCTREM